MTIVCTRSAGSLVVLAVLLATGFVDDESLADVTPYVDAVPGGAQSEAGNHEPTR